MFDILEKTQKRAMPRWLAGGGAMLGMFNLGLWTGKWLMGAKPEVDWFVTMGNFVWTVVFTTVCAVYAFKSDAMTK